MILKKQHKEHSKKLASDSVDVDWSLGFCTSNKLLVLLMLPWSSVFVLRVVPGSAGSAAHSERLGLGPSNLSWSKPSWDSHPLVWGPQSLFFLTISQFSVAPSPPLEMRQHPVIISSPAPVFSLIKGISLIF